MQIVLIKFNDFISNSRIKEILFVSMNIVGLFTYYSKEKESNICCNWNII